MTNILTSITTLSIVLFALLTYNFIGAEWIPAPSTPPADNAAAPINVSGTPQTKAGNLGANRLVAGTAVWSDRYCDGNGSNCHAIGNAGSYAGTFVRHDTPWLWCRTPNPFTGACSCPSGFSQASLGGFSDDRCGQTDQDATMCRAGRDLEIVNCIRIN